MTAVPCEAAETAVIARPAFSNVSFASRARLLPPEFWSTVALSSTMSATALTVIDAVAAALSSAPSKAV
jgi:hypothetical protein